MRKRTRNVLPAALVAGGLIVAAGCDDAAGPSEGSGTLVLRFDHTVDGAELVLDQMVYTNAAGNPYSVTLLEYVVCHFALEAEIPSQEDLTTHVVHYRDQAQESTRDLVLENVPAGDYSTLRFIFGLPGDDNVTGAFPDLDAAGMAWPAMMGGGYHYMRHEGNYLDGQSQTVGYTTHTGPSGGADFSVEVALDLDAAGGGLRHGFSIAESGTTTVWLSMNVNEWYANPNVYDLNDHGAIMGDPAAQQALQENGANVWSVSGITLP